MALSDGTSGDHFMLIGYASGHLERICTTAKSARKAYPDDVAAKIPQQLGTLAAYNHLGEVPFNSAPLRFHSLKADYAGCFAVRLSAKMRLIFRPAGLVSYLNHNDVDRDSVTAIEVVAIEDYHE